MPAATPIRGFMRGAARYLSEPHPMNRMPTTGAIHRSSPADAAKHMGRIAGMYVPGAIVVFGWPYAFYKLLDGRV